MLVLMLSIDATVLIFMLCLANLFMVCMTYWTYNLLVCIV